LDFIPAELKKGVELKPFADLNSLIASGSQPKITELENFIRDIDRVVPVISIEVIVLEVSNTAAVSKGLTVGLSETPVKTEGTLFPGLDMTISSGSINAVLDKIGGIGSLVLGRVSPNFYATLKLLESNGALRVRSTPKLSTLNGHDATMSIGQTEYYLETQNAVVGTQNPQNITTQSYKSVNADLSLAINPIVSGDEQITLDIKVKQSTFTARISPTAPPGNVTRDFQSLIRIKNEEMIMLGGLEENSTNDTGKGFPGLARVPVLKWIFSNREKSRKKSKLVILVKPTVLY
jgi:type IV pilus assembly protein PilQ